MGGFETEPFSGENRADHYDTVAPRFNPDNTPWAKHQRIGLRLAPPTDEQVMRIIQPHQYTFPKVAEEGLARVIRFPVERTRPPESPQPRAA